MAETRLVGWHPAAHQSASAVRHAACGCKYYYQLCICYLAATSVARRLLPAKAEPHLVGWHPASHLASSWSERGRCEVVRSRGPDSRWARTPSLPPPRPRGRWPLCLPPLRCSVCICKACHRPCCKSSPGDGSGFCSLFTSPRFSFTSFRPHVHCSASLQLSVIFAPPPDSGCGVKNFASQDVLRIPAGRPSA